jgi:hypothetical protein
VRGKQICELDLPVERIHIVAILVDFAICNCRHDVADLQPGFHCRHIRFHIRNVNAAALAFFSGKLAQFRIAGWEKREASGRETAIILAISFL